MLGAVKEKEGGAVAPMVAVGGSKASHSLGRTGFPSAKSSAGGSLSSASLTMEKVKTHGQPVMKASALGEGGGGGAAAGGEADYRLENTKRVLSMSEAEVEQAIAELSSMLSPKTLELMQKRGLEQIQAQDGKSKADDRLASKVSEGQKDSRVKKVPSQHRDYIASSLEELQEMQRNAPEEVRANLAWAAIDDEKSEDEKRVEATTGTAAAPSTSTSSRTNKDRFDLNGCKVIHCASVVQVIGKALAATGLASSRLEAIATDLVTGALSAGFCIEPKEEQDCQPQNELLQHERDPDLPGYSLVEICEMFRSDVPHQRTLALRMLNGILRRREEVVATEAYDDNALIDEGFLGIFQDAVRACLSASSAGEQVCKEQEADIRRVVTFATLHLCAADLPVALPTLLLWGLKIKKLSVQTRLASMQCMKHYIFSPIEEHAASLLWTGFWGLFGCPSLPTPHARRDELSYEEFVLQCFSKRMKEIDPEVDAKDEETKPVYENFALRCRWGRIDTMALDGNLCQVLVNILRNTLDELEELGEVTDSSSSNGLVEIMLKSSIVIMEILCACARLGDRNTVDLVFDDVVKREWSMFEKVLSSRSEHTSLRCVCYRLLAELLRRDCGAARWLVTTNKGFLNSILSEVLQTCSEGVKEEGSPPKDLTWALRLWRVLLAYGVGIEGITELLLASKLALPGNGSVNPTSCACYCFGPGLRVYEASNVVETMWLLEQASVTSAYLIRKELDALAPSHEKKSDAVQEEPLPPSTAGMSTLLGLVETAQMLLDAAEQVTREVIVTTPMEAEDHSPLVRAAAMHFASSVLGLRLPKENSSLPSKLATCALIRGNGLLASCLECLSRYYMTSDVDARFVQLDAKMQSFLSACRRGAAASSHIAGKAGSQTFTATKTTNSMIWEQSELLFSSHRYLVGLFSFELAPSPSALASLSSSFRSVRRLDVPSVAEGLLEWQLLRLQQAHGLVEAFSHCVSAITRDEGSELALITSIMPCLGLLGQGMVGPAYTLAKEVIAAMMSASARQHQPQEDIGLAEKVLSALFGQDTDATLQLSIDSSLFFLGAQCVVEKDQRVKQISSLGDWIHEPYNPHLPLPGDWTLRCAASLSAGKSFASWLSVIAIIKSHTQSADGDTNTSREAESLYRLLRLSNPEFADKWIDLYAEEKDGEEAGGAFEPMETAIASFLSLVPSYACKVASKADGVVEFSHATQSESFAASNMLRRNPRRRGEALHLQQDLGNRKGAGRSSEVGQMELCTKLIESASGPHIRADVHSYTLIILICPLISTWRVQERVWRELGALGLLHLLECSEELWLPLAPLFSPFLERERTLPAVARAIAEALTRLRDPVADRLWITTSIGVQTIARCLFQQQQQQQQLDVEIQGTKARLLVEILDPHSTLKCPTWLVRDILAFAATATSAEPSARDVIAFWALARQTSFVSFVSRVTVQSTPSSPPRRLADLCEELRQGEL